MSGQGARVGSTGVGWPLARKQSLSPEGRVFGLLRPGHPCSAESGEAAARLWALPSLNLPLNSAGRPASATRFLPEPGGAMPRTGFPSFASLGRVFSSSVSGPRGWARHHEASGPSAGRPGGAGARLLQDPRSPRGPRPKTLEGQLGASRVCARQRKDRSGASEDSVGRVAQCETARVRGATFVRVPGHLSRPHFCTWRPGLVGS